MSFAINASEFARVRLCVTPGCPNEADRGEFCDFCKRDLPARERRRLWQRAEMRKQAELAAVRERSKATDDLHKLREQKRDQKQRLVDGRVLVMQRLDRMRIQAARRGDELLVRALNAGIDAVATELVRVKRPSLERTS